MVMLMEKEEMELVDFLARKKKSFQVEITLNFYAQFVL